MTRPSARKSLSRSLRNLPLLNLSQSCSTKCCSPVLGKRCLSCSSLNIAWLSTRCTLGILSVLYCLLCLYCLYCLCCCLLNCCRLASLPTFLSGNCCSAPGNTSYMAVGKGCISCHSQPVQTHHRTSGMSTQVQRKSFL